MNKLIQTKIYGKNGKVKCLLFIIKKNNKPINRRLKHIQLIHQTLFNQPKGVPRSQRKSFERLIHILTYTTNIEFSKLIDHLKSRIR